MFSQIIFAYDMFEAIEQLDVSAVAKFANHENLSHEKRKQTLDLANSVLESYEKKSTSLLSSKGDLTRLLAGAILAYIGLRIAKGSVSQGFKLSIKADASKAIKGGLLGFVFGALLTAGGVWQIYEGYHLKSGLNNLDKAHEIRNIIRDTK